MTILHTLKGLFSNPDYDLQVRSLLKEATAMKKQKAYDLAALRIRTALDIVRTRQAGLTQQELMRLGDYLTLAGKRQEAFDEYMKAGRCHYTPHWRESESSGIATLGYGYGKASLLFSDVGDELREIAFEVAGLYLWGVCPRLDGESNGEWKKRKEKERESARQEIECALDSRLPEDVIKKIADMAEHNFGRWPQYNQDQMGQDVFLLLGGAGRFDDVTSLSNPIMKKKPDTQKRRPSRTPTGEQKTEDGRFIIEPPC